MVLKIITYFFLPFLFVAVFLATLGVQEITLDDNFYSFLINVNVRMSQYTKLSNYLPSIPSIPLLVANSSGWFDFLNVLINIVNVIIQLGNFLLGLIRTLLDVLEWIIAFYDVAFNGLTYFAP